MWMLVWCRQEDGSGSRRREVRSGQVGRLENDLTILRLTLARANISGERGKRQRETGQTRSSGKCMYRRIRTKRGQVKNTDDDEKKSGCTTLSLTNRAKGAGWPGTTTTTDRTCSWKKGQEAEQASPPSTTDETGITWGPARASKVRFSRPSVLSRDEDGRAAAAHGDRAL